MTPRIPAIILCQTCTCRLEDLEPNSSRSLIAYLGGGAIAGVGPVTARRMVNGLGDSVLEILDGAGALIFFQSHEAQECLNCEVKRRCLGHPGRLGCAPRCCAPLSRGKASCLKEDIDLQGPVRGLKCESRSRNIMLGIAFSCHARTSEGQDKQPPSLSLDDRLDRVF